MHEPCFTYRTEAGIKTGKPDYSFLPGFFDFCFRLFCSQRLNPVFLLAAKYTVIPDLNKPLGKNMQAEPSQELNYERNRINTLEKEHLYRRRQAIVEHPYGTIKRQWGFNYILPKKGIARAGSDVGFMFIAYNLRRIGNILTMNVLKEYLRILVSVFLSKLHLSELKSSSFGSRFIQFLVLDRKFRDSLIPA